jgi:hypothetical protein
LAYFEFNQKTRLLGAYELEVPTACFVEPMHASRPPSYAIPTCAIIYIPSSPDAAWRLISTVFNAKGRPQSNRSARPGSWCVEVFVGLIGYDWGQ